MKRKINLPSIKGDLTLIPLVLEAFNNVPSGDKREIRTRLKAKFEKQLVKVVDGKKVTRDGRVLNSDKELKGYLEKTLLDGLALPTCERFRLISRGEKYQLTSRGIKLLEVWEKNKDIRSNQRFRETLGSILVQLDKEEWGGLIEALLQLQYEKGSSLSIKELKNSLDIKVPEYYITNILKFFKDVNIVSSDNQGKYMVNAEKYEEILGKKLFRNYSEVSDSEFFAALFSVYKELTRNTRSPYVWISDMRNKVCRELKWPWEYFNRRLSKIPLIIGNKQLLFSPSTFGKKGGIYRNGKYYNFISIYER